MKKLFLLAMAVLFGIGTTMAGPIDVNTAKTVGQKFAQATFKTGGGECELVYTFATKRGDACFYAFNVDQKGFVVVSADDRFRPVVGYCDGDVFDVNNPEMMYYLNCMAEGRTIAEKRSVDPKVPMEWESVMTNGRPLSYNGGRGVDYLVKTKWNQNPAPFNSMCPADAGAPGGHAYVGCVATAMSQVMKYWNYPAQGQGSHSYVPQDHPNYGTQTANFGATTYDWDNMLNTYSAGSYTPEQGDAVALLCWHCGVSVNMNYGNDADGGSGASTQNVPAAISSYFRYTTAASLQYKGNLTVWMNTLKDAFDKGWPMYYAGVESGSPYGHAFVCDGYKDSDYFHFNWGWGGSGDNWFLIDEIDYNTQNTIVTNFVPADIYNNTAQAPTNFTVTKASDIAQEAAVSWTNPIKTMNTSDITNIDQIVVERDGVIIYTADNVAPGAAMSFVDDNVPCYSTFEYRVYAIIGGAKGNSAKATESFGPTCEWKIVATATDMQGWKNGMLIAYDGAGREISTFTMTNNTPQNIPFNVTLGRVRFAWKSGTEDVTLSFKIKDANGTVVYDFPQGSSAGIPEGIFFESNNGCTSTVQCETPTDLYADAVDGNVVLSWTGVDSPDYGYNIYRDGFLFELAHTNEFVDETAGIGGHCYQVCVLCEGGESGFSNEACGNAGEGCEPGSNLWYELQNNNKPIITWTAPENTEGLSGYFIYRKVNDEEYTQIKIVAANKTEYKETKAMEEGNWYSYRVVAYYQGIDCYAAPIKAKYGNEYFVKVYYSTTGVNENADGKVNLYPNPTKESFTIEGEGLQSVMVYNTVGQLVYNRVCEGNSTVIDLGNVESGIYMVKVVTANGETVQKVSVIR